MKTGKKLASLLLALCMALTLTGAAVAEGAPITLQVWYAVSGNNGEVFTAIANGFAAEHPDISLELSYSGNSSDTATKVSAAQLTGTAPDVALMYAGPLYTGGQGNYALEELIEDPDFAKDDIFSGVWEYTKYDGRICAIPYAISTQLMYYNKTLFDAAGIDMTTPPATWAEFEALLVKLAEANKDNADFVAFDTSDAPWMIKSMFMQNGCPVVERTDEGVVPVFNNEKAVEVAEFWKSLVDQGLMIAGEHDNAENKFLAGTCGIIAATSGRLARWTELEFELGAFALPSFDQPAVALGGAVLVILTEDPARVPAAWEFVKYMASSENGAAFSTQTGYLPVRASALELPIVTDLLANNALYKAAFDQMQSAWAYTHYEQMGTMDALIWEAVDNLERGNGTPKECLDNAVAELLVEMEN